MSIKVKVLLFAILKEHIGHGSLELELPLGAQVKDLIELLERDFLQVGELKDHLLIARAQEYLKAESELSQGDELSLYPPLSGG